MGEDQWRSESSLETSVKYNAKPAAASLPKTSLLRNWLWVGIGIFVLLLFSSGLIIFHNIANKKNKSDAVTSEIKIQEIDLSQLGENVTTLDSNSSDQVVVNGQIQANQGIVLTPSEKPINSLPGQIYFDINSKQINYFNGQIYVPFASQLDITSIQGTVSSLQGQIATLLATVNASGAGGKVISVQSLSNEITLSGTNGLTITTSGQNIAINLPQLLSTAGTPQFSSISLATALSVSSGGIGVNTLTSNGVLYGNGNGPVQTASTGVAGLCLLSTIGAPTWGLCSAGSASTLQDAYDTGNTIVTTTNRNIDITLADTAIDSDLVIDIAGTGNIIEFRDSGTPFFTASDGGVLTFQSVVNNTSAFEVRNNSGTPIFVVDTVGNAAGAYGFISANSENSANVLQSYANGASSNAVYAAGVGAGSIGVFGRSELGSSAAFRTTNTSGTNVNSTVVIQSNTSQTADLLQFLDNGSNRIAGFNVNGQLGLGRASANTGTILFSNSSNANVITLQSGLATAARILTLPDETGTVCSTGSVCSGYAPASGSGSYIQFAPSSAQVDASTNNTIFVNKTGVTGNILQLQNSGTDVFLVQNGGTIVGNGSYVFNGVATDITTANNEDLTVIATGSGQIILNDTVQVTNLGSADNTNYLCRNTSNQVATCSTTGAGSVFMQDGNSFGSLAVLGTNDANALSFETSGVTQATLAVGGALTLQNSVNSSGALRVLNSSAVPVLTVDTTAQSGNLVTNGTFEGDTLGVEPVGWDPKNSPTSVLASNTVARTGSQSMSINIDGAGGVNQGAEFPVTLAGLTNYNLAFWLRSSSGTLTDVYIGYRSAGVDASVCTSTTNVISTSWTQITCSFTTGVGPSATSIFVKKSAASAVTIYADDVALYNTSGSKIVLGSSTNGVLGQLQFGSDAGGSVTFQTSPGATALQNFTIGIPLESGTLCTDNINSACSITGDLKYLNKNKIDLSTASVGTNGTLYTFTNSNAGDTGRVLALQNGNNRGAALYLANTVNPVTYPDSVLLQVINNSSNRLRIFSGGQVGIDTSSLAPSDDATFGDVAFGGGAGITRTINPLKSTNAGSNGAALQISGGASKTTGTGGALNLHGGAGDTSGTGGAVNIYGGVGGGASNDGNVFINAHNIIVRPTVDNTTAFRVQNAAGSTSYLTVDSSTPAVTLRAATDIFSDSATAFNVKTAGGSAILTVDNTSGAITLNHDTTINDELNIFTDAANALLVEDTTGEDIFRVDTLSEDIYLGSINLTGNINIENGTGASISIGTTNSSRVINIGTTGVAPQTINIGSVHAGSALTLTAGGGINVASGLDFNSGVDVNFVGGASNFDQSLSSGYFSTGTGTVNLNGNVTIGSGMDLTMLGSGTFTTGTGAVSIRGTTALGDATTDRLTVTAQIQGGSPLVFQGATDDSFTSTLAFADPTANHTFTFPDVGVGASDTVCLVTLGNCAGSGSGVTTPGGVSGNIAKFTGGQTIDDSTLSESGTVLTASGSLIVQGSSGLTLGVASTTTGNVVFRNSTNANTLTIQSGATSTNTVLTLPTDDGLSNQCLKTDGTGVLSFTNCVGGGGGADAVTDLNTFTGSVSIVGTANQVNVANSLNVITLSTPQSIATTSDVTFDTVTANGGILVTGAISSINDSSNFATNINTGTSTGSVTIGNNSAGVFSLQSGSTISIATTGGTPTIGRTGITTTIAGTLTVNETANLNENTNIGNASTDRLTITSEILGGTPFVFQGATDNGFSTSFQVTDPTAARTVTIPNNSGVITLNTSGSSAAGTSAFVQGGVTWAGLATLGTNDSNSLDIETNNVTRLTFDTSGNLTVATLNNASTHTLGVASTTTAATNGDALTISSGAGNTSGAGGLLTLQAGAGGATGNGGAVSILGGTAAAGNGGAITLQAAAGVGTNKAGGDITLTAGTSTGTGDSGDFVLTAGNGGSQTGGDFTFTSGNGGGANRGGNFTVNLGSGAGAGIGGGFILQGGTGGATGDGGAISLTGGTGGSDENGGVINITGGTGGSNAGGSSRTGGDVNITGGAVGGLFDAGDVILTSGSFTGSQSQIILSGAGTDAFSYNTGSSISLQAGNPGTTGGGIISIISGNSSNSSVASGSLNINTGNHSSGGNSGSISVSSGTVTASGSGIGPSSGALSFSSANAGDGAATFAGGTSGTITLQTGTGGTGGTTGAGGVAGAITLQGGNGGTGGPSAGNGGNGSAINILSGNGGTNGSGSLVGGSGGAINITAGQGVGLANGGTITLTAGSENNGSTRLGGTLTLTGGSFASSGAALLQGGGGGTASIAGASATVRGGTAVGAFAGGAAILQGGTAAATAGSNGGAAQVLGAAGTSTGTGGTGGAVTITAGNSFGSAANTGGAVTITSGNGSPTGAGGNITLTTGNGGSTSGNSGNISVDVGTVTSGTRGTISVGNTNASALTFGRTTVLTTIAGTLQVNENANFDGSTLTIGNASSDAVTVNSAAWTFANDTTFALSGGVNGLNIDSDTLSVDATNNRIGLGTNAPSYRLHLRGTGSEIIMIEADSDDVTETDHAQLLFSQDGGNTLGMLGYEGGLNNLTLETQTSNSLILGTNNTTRLTITSSGSATYSGGTTGDAMTISNSTSTGNILVLNDNATGVLTVADGGAVNIINSVDSATAFNVQTAAGITVFTVDTSNSRVGTASVSGAATSSQTLTLRSGNATGTGASNSGDIIIRSGNSTNSNSGNVQLDVGSAGGTLGSVSIGSTYVATAINIGQVAANSISSTVNIATATNGTQAVTIGSTSVAGNSLTLQAGSGGGITANGNISLNGNLTPNAAGTRDLGSATLEFDELFLADDSGLVLGLDSDATLGYDEAGDDRVELTGTGASLFIEDRLSLGVQIANIADTGDANPATLTLTPTASYIEVSCNDVDTCDITMGEASAKQGDLVIILVTTATGTADFTDSAGVSELAGNFNAGVNDVVSMIYMGTAWVEISRSNN